MDSNLSNSNSPAARTPLDLEVNFKRSYARNDAVCIMKNISLTGAFIEYSGEMLRADEKINLQIVVEGRERKLAASVVWSNASGCGVKFLPVNNRDVQIVDDLIYYVENDRYQRRDVVNEIFKKVG